MIEHVQSLASHYGPELIGLVVTVTVGVVLRSYGRHLERKTREVSARQIIR